MDFGSALNQAFNQVGGSVGGFFNNLGTTVHNDLSDFGNSISNDFQNWSQQQQQQDQQRQVQYQQQNQDTSNTLAEDFKNFADIAGQTAQNIGTNLAWLRQPSPPPFQGVTDAFRQAMSQPINPEFDPLGHFFTTVGTVPIQQSAQDILGALPGLGVPAANEIAQGLSIPKAIAGAAGLAGLEKVAGVSNKDIALSAPFGALGALKYEEGATGIPAVDEMAKEGYQAPEGGSNALIPAIDAVKKEVADMPGGFDADTKRTPGNDEGGTIQVGNLPITTQAKAYLDRLQPIIKNAADQFDQDPNIWSKILQEENWDKYIDNHPDYNNHGIPDLNILPGPESLSKLNGYFDFIPTDPSAIRLTQTMDNPIDLQVINQFVKENGYPEVSLARPNAEGGYDLLDGTHRFALAPQIGIDKLPALILGGDRPISDSYTQQKQITITPQDLVSQYTEAIQNKPIIDQVSSIIGQLTGTEVSTRTKQPGSALNTLQTKEKSLDQLSDINGINFTGTKEQLQNALDLFRNNPNIKIIKEDNVENKGTGYTGTHIDFTIPGSSQTYEAQFTAPGERAIQIQTHGDYKSNQAQEAQEETKAIVPPVTKATADLIRDNTGQFPSIAKLGDQLTDQVPKETFYEINAPIARNYGGSLDQVDKAIAQNGDKIAHNLEDYVQEKLPTKEAQTRVQEALMGRIDPSILPPDEQQVYSQLLPIQEAAKDKLGDNFDPNGSILEQVRNALLVRQQAPEQPMQKLQPLTLNSAGFQNTGNYKEAVADSLYNNPQALSKTSTQEVSSQTIPPPESQYLEGTTPVPGTPQDLTQEQKDVLAKAAQGENQGPPNQSSQDIATNVKTIQNDFRAAAGNFRAEQWIDQKQAEGDIKFFDGMSKAEHLEFLQRAESGIPQPTPELQAVADQLKAERDQDYMILSSFRSNIPYNADSYSRTGLWKDPEQAAAFFNSFMQQQSLAGKVDALHGRVFPTIFDGIQAGLEVKETNPAILQVNATTQTLRLEMADSFMQEQEAKGADPTLVNKVVQQYLDPGLSGNRFFRGTRAATNAINSINLLGGFHFGGTAINAVASKVAIGLRQIFTTKDFSPISGLTNIITAPIGPLQYVFKGNQILGKLDAGMIDDPEVRGLIEGGQRFNMPEIYRMTGWDNAVDNLHSDNLGTKALGVVQAPFAGLLKGVATLTRPLMEWWVPRIKAGAAADILNTNLEKLGPDATIDQKRQAAAGAVDSVDNRFGQLNQDNLFWNNTLKDLGSLAMRSPGWNIGTVRELGGGALDLLDIRNAFNGKGLTDRAAYMLALPIIVGALGGAYQYLHTGQGPQAIEDYFFPKTGQIDTKTGKEERVSFPTYAKDVYAFMHNPPQTVYNKLNPILQNIVQLAQNKDYFGNDIRDLTQPADVQAKQAIAHTAQAILPFSLQTQTNRINSSGETSVESFLGLNKAPSSVTGGYYSVKNSIGSTLNPNQQKTWEYFQTPSAQGGPTAKEKEQMLFNSGNNWLLGKEQQLQNQVDPKNPLWNKPLDYIKAYYAWKIAPREQKYQLEIKHPDFPSFDRQVQEYTNQTIKNSQQATAQKQQNKGVLGAISNAPYNILGVQPATQTEKVPSQAAYTLPPPSPLQQLTPQQVQAVAAYAAANVAGNKGEKKAILAQNPWLVNYWNARAAYNQANPISATGGSVTGTLSPLDQYLQSQGIPITTPTGTAGGYSPYSQRPQNFASGNMNIPGLTNMAGPTSIKGRKTSNTKGTSLKIGTKGTSSLLGKTRTPSLKTTKLGTAPKTSTFKPVKLATPNMSATTNAFVGGRVFGGGTGQGAFKPAKISMSLGNKSLGNLTRLASSLGRVNNFTPTRGRLFNPRQPRGFNQSMPMAQLTPLATAPSVPLTALRVGVPNLARYI